MRLPSYPPLFRPGQKVICTDDDFKELLSRVPTMTALPIKGQSYIVRLVVWIPLVSKYGLLLEGINNPMLWHSKLGNFEPTFDEKRFAPEEDMQAMELMLEEALGFIKIREPELV